MTKKKSADPLDDADWPKPNARSSSDHLPFKYRLARAARLYPFQSNVLTATLLQRLGDKPGARSIEKIFDLTKELYYEYVIDRVAAESILIESQLVGVDELYLMIRGDVRHKLQENARMLVDYWHLYRP